MAEQWEKMDEDEEEEEVDLNAPPEAEKTEEQRREEAKRRWKSFHYNPPDIHRDPDGEPTGRLIATTQWAGPVFFFLFIICIINLVLTLDQWHGTHGWRDPFDLVPLDKRPGGWPQVNHNIRFTGSIVGSLGCAFNWVMKPTADKYRCFTFILLFASIMLFVAFGFDLAELQKAVNLPYCRGINDMKTHKFLCEFDEYRATVIMDIIAGFISLILAIVVCYQAQQGWVSRVMVYNELTSSFEKAIPNPDKAWYFTYPREFRTWMRPTQVIAVFGLLANLSVVGLGATQSAGFFMQPPGYLVPQHNDAYTVPRNVYVIGATEAIRYGSWAELNFLLRLSVNTVALVTLAIAIQWRRDGRFGQLIIITLGLAAGIIYMVAFAIDWEELAHWLDAGCAYEHHKGSRCVYHRYFATVIFDAFCGLLMILFFLRNLCVWCSQARQPVERNHVPYGWWCFGEWEEKQREKDEEEARTARLGRD